MTLWRTVAEALSPQDVWSTVGGVLLATVGGVCRLLNTAGSKKIGYRRVFAEILTATFCGMMMALLTFAISIVGAWRGIFCGVAGWTSPNILNVLTRLTETKGSFEEGELKKK